jgi:hypothetical protein
MKNAIRAMFSVKSIILILVLFFGCQQNKFVGIYKSDWPKDIHRTWIGPDYWANPLQDWEIENGKLKCLVSDYNRNVSLLTWEKSTNSGSMTVSVQLGLIDEGILSKRGWAGFCIGKNGRFDDYRDDALYGWGINAGLTTTGNLFIGKLTDTDFTNNNETVISLLKANVLFLDLQAEYISDDQYALKLSLWSEGSKIDSLHKSGFANQDILGLIALVVDFPRPSLNNEFEAYLEINRTKKEIPSFWFSQWQATGSTFLYHPNREFGPVLFAQHTLSKGIMKMTAQMPPISKAESQDVYLEIEDNSGKWENIGITKIDNLSRTASFRITRWEDKNDIPYRLSYDLSVGSNQQKKYFFNGTVRKDPIEKNEIVIAGFTGNNDLGFPNKELVKHVNEHQPDILFFSGDQIYESVGGYGYMTTPPEKSTLDYLRKWYLYGWEYRDLLRNIPAVSIPDDHDVYHGNLWGEGGKAASKSGDRNDQQDSGGYMQPPEWVNMVERTQTSHLPDPYDPAPVVQGIGVYYTDLLYGGISIAIIEDRKFKSAPNKFFPKEYRVKNGWVENSQYRDPRLLNVSGAKLLGERQMIFLEDWIDDWSDGTWMKVLFSQTIFSTVATLPDSSISDVVVPKLRILEKGDYPEDDVPTQDMDSNGWPKIERDRVLKILRKGFAIHLAGDQHLGSTIQYGVESWGDASFAMCVPSVANYFPRRWFPKEGPIDWQAETPKNLGNFYDGFGNRITVHAVANPYFTNLKPSSLYDRATGYGIIKMSKETREIEMANWPRQVDPSHAKAQPYEGWPVKFHQLDNYNRKAVAWLPTLKFKAEINPVVHIIDEKNNDLVYALRIIDSDFSPRVFNNGLYTIRISCEGRTKELTGIQSTTQENSEYLEIEL